VGAFALFTDETEIFDGTRAGGSEPVRGAGVELRGFSGPEDHVALAEHEAQCAVEDVDPVVALVRAQVGFAIVVCC
jgi:hypothetical protein